MNIHLQPVPEDFLHRVREVGLDDQGQPVRRMRARGGEPCRDVLRRAHPGEELILASFSPFARSGPYKEFGPVFVLANASGETVRRDALLPVSSDTSTYFRQQFVLRAYDRDGAIFDAALVERETATDVLERFLALDEIDFVDARFPTYGCFACRITRA